MGDRETDEKRYGSLDKPADDEVVESCGCVFCDLEDVPELINGVPKHHYLGRDGRLVPCTKRLSS